MAAYTSGIKTVLIPRDNLRDLEEIDAEAREHLKFIPCDTVIDALSEVLAEIPTAMKPEMPAEKSAAIKADPHLITGTGTRQQRSTAR